MIRRFGRSRLQGKVLVRVQYILHMVHLYVHAGCTPDTCTTLPHKTQFYIYESTQRRKHT